MKPQFLIGVPTTAGCRRETSTAIDQNRGPDSLRAAYRKLMADFDITTHFQDRGDLSFNDTVPEMLTAVETAASDVAKEGGLPILIGGAHTMSVGTLRGLYKIHGEFSLVYLDAHPDLMPRDSIDYGSSLYHALQERVITGKRMALIGARQIERQEAEVIQREGIHVVAPRDIVRQGIASVTAEILKTLPPPYVISFDLDVLDPTYAPGVTSPTPLGVNPLDALSLCQALCEKNVLGLEIVELSPKNDRNNQTAQLAAGFLKELSEALAKAS